MTDASPADQDRFPSLQISDLLVLTLTVSFALACITPAIQDYLSRSNTEQRMAMWRAITPQVTEYAAIGISICGLLVLCRQRIRGSHWEWSPGHWLFVAFGPLLAVLLVTGAVRDVIAAYLFDNNPKPFFATINALISFVVGASIVFTLPALWIRERRWWLAILLVLVWLTMVVIWLFMDALAMLGYVRSSFWRRPTLAFMTTTHVVALLAAFVAVGMDVLKGIRRDWLHYLAIAALSLNALSYVLNWGEITAKWWYGLFLSLIP